jgi:glycosyltransferase involved in cell wall biosynthesis
VRVMMSVSWANTIPVAPGTYDGQTVEVVPRRSDWGKRGVRKALHHVIEGLRLLRVARRYDALIVCTAGIEAFVAARLGRVYCRRTRIVIADVLLPGHPERLRMARSWLRHAHAIGCIRQGDLQTLQNRFDVSSDRCFFIPFPTDPSLPDSSSQDDGYLYSAGWAHRDWPTLVAALGTVPFPAKLSAGVTLAVPEDARGHISLLQMQTPDSGRALMGRASLVVLAFVDTDLPSGPLLLLDAMAMGKPVVATDVNGTRDYIRDGRTGFLVPPGDPYALADAVRMLVGDPDLRHRVGAEARRDVLSRFTPDRFIKGLLSACMPDGPRAASEPIAPNTSPQVRERSSDDSPTRLSWPGDRRMTAVQVNDTSRGAAPGSSIDDPASAGYQDGTDHVQITECE